MVFHIDKTFSKKPFRILTVFFLSIALCPRTGGGAERNLGFGGEIGYCASNLAGVEMPELVRGGVLGLHLLYHINDTFSLSLEGNFDWYPPYQTYKLDQVTADTPDGGTETVVGWVHGPWIGKTFLTTGALSLVYKIDVMRLMPYLAAGINASYSTLKSGTRYYYGSELGLRLGVGADYMFSSISGAGIALHNDISLLGDLAFTGRLAVIVRFIYYFGVENFGKRRRQG